jgi:hypothetical protein
MKAIRLSPLWLALVAALVLLSPAHAAPAPEAKSPPTPLPGREIAETVSTVTGVAISPLLGVGAYGAYHWWKAPVERRGSLPWFAQPWFWIPALLLVGMCLAKDTLGTAAPAALKKPFDVAETVEHKISGLVAAGLFVPLVAMVFGQPESASASWSGMGLAALDLSWLGNALMVPLLLAAYLIVFLASTAINILILLSPFSTVDAGLKLFRGTVLATVVASSFANPWLGAVWALVLILISALIAGWSFRLSVLGTLFVWDFLTLRKRRFQLAPGANRLFLGRKTEKVPTRTYGSLVRDGEGRLVFRYRPWLVLPERQITLPAGQYAVGRGLVHSSILHVNGDEARFAFLLPPRYRSHEEELSNLYGLLGVRPAGLRALGRWFKEVLGFGGSPQPAAA